MNELLIKYLEDILNCIIEIDEFVATGERTYSHFTKNTLLRRAVERNFEIIGEATNRIKKVSPETNIKSNKQIINLRNLIIHSYDNINHQVLWAIVINDLPNLKIEVQDIISSLKH